MNTAGPGQAAGGWALASDSMLDELKAHRSERAPWDSLSGCQSLICLPHVCALQIPEDPIGTVSCGWVDRQPSYHRCQTARKLDRLSSCRRRRDSERSQGGFLQRILNPYSLVSLQLPPFDPCVPQFVMFHGCYHDASGSWPYDPVSAPAQRSTAHAALVDVQLQNCTT